VEGVAAFSGERSGNAELKLLKHSANNRTFALYTITILHY